MNTTDKYESPFVFLGFKVREMHFKINEQSDGQRFPLDFDIDSDFEYEEEIDQIKCAITLKVKFFKTLTAKNEDYPFNFEVVVDGYFAASLADISPERFKKMAEKNGVAILFPYLRSIICDASKMANIQPILLPSINVVKFIEDRHKSKDNS